MIRETVFAKSAQVGGSSCAENFLGYIIDQAPSAVLEVWPTEKALRAWSTKRLDPMLSDTPCFKVRFPKSGRRDSKDSIASKEFAGGYIQALTAKSTADLRSHSSRVAVAEEVDEWEGDVGDQGDPLELLRARMRTFWNAKLYMVSTPTLAGILPDMERARDVDVGRVLGSLPSLRSFPDAPVERRRPGQVRVWPVSPGVGEGRRRRADPRNMLLCLRELRRADRGTLQVVDARRGIQARRRRRLAPEVPRARQSRVPHQHDLFAALPVGRNRALVYARARRPTEMKTFVNTMLGLPYEESGDKVDSNFLAHRTQAYAAEVPHGVGVLTAGVDVQADRLEALVYGYGAGEQSWLIAREQFEGDPWPRRSLARARHVPKSSSDTKAARWSGSPRPASTPATRRNTSSASARRDQRGRSSPPSAARAAAAS
jgi:hypothetical protein